MITNVDEVRERSDILAIIGGHVQLRRAGSSYQGLCPFHEERTPSFTVSPDKQAYYCFGCGKSGNIFGFVMDYFSKDFPEAVEYLANKSGINLVYSSRDAEQTYRRKKTLTEVLNLAANIYREKFPGSEAEKYVMHERKLTQDTTEHFELGYAPDSSWDFLYNRLRREKIESELMLEAGLIIQREDKSGYYDRFRNGLIIPLKDSNRNVIGFAKRALDDSKPKYLNSPGGPLFRKEEHLFGLHEVAREVKGELVIVEGYFDKIAAWQAGVKNLIATCGTALTQKHASILEKRFPCTKIILGFDGDEAGVKATLNAGKTLLGRTNSYVCLFPEGKDPADIVKEGRDLNSYLQQSTPFLEFYIKQEGKKFDCTNFEGQQTFLESISREIYPQVPRRMKKIFVENIHNLTGLSENSLVNFFVDVQGELNRNTSELEKKLLGQLWSMNGNHVKNFISLDPSFNLSHLSSPETKAFFSYLQKEDRISDYALDSPLFQEEAIKKTLVHIEKIYGNNGSYFNKDGLQELVLTAAQFRKSVKRFEEIELTYFAWKMSKLGNGNLERWIRNSLGRGNSTWNIIGEFSGIKKRLEE